MVLRVLREERIGSQGDLLRALATRGVTVAQPTLSRDLQELGIVRASDGDGGVRYAAPAETPAGPELARVLPALLSGVDGVGALLVLRTRRGGAGAVAAAVQGAAWPEVLGALAGDDTVLVIARSQRARQSLATRLRPFVLD